MSANNPLTTGKIAGKVYDLRHWKLALAVGTVVVIARFVSGRTLRLASRTDATFLHGARFARRGVWASAPGWVRIVVRFGLVLAVWCYFTHPVVVWVLGVLFAVVGVWAFVLYWRARQHERKVLAPVWPAVAGIIGVPATDHPSAWLYIPTDPTAPGADLTVGLREADIKDDERVQHLLTLFGQRYQREWVASIDYAARLVHLSPRPEEHSIWSAVAGVIGVDPGSVSSEWLAIEGQPDLGTADPKSKITVDLPIESTDDARITEGLKRLLSNRFGGEWNVRTDRAARQVAFTRKPPPAVPPTYVDFLAQHPDYQPKELPQEVSQP